MKNNYLLDWQSQTITLEGISYSASTLHLLANRYHSQTPGFISDLVAFLKEWFNEYPTIQVQTSGSTGSPKKLIVRKEQMMRSASLTCDFLDLKQGDKALLCMPLTYIAGKMMVVRALVAGLDLIPRSPSGHPLSEIENETIRFAAMIPLQVYNSLQLPEEKSRLEKIGILIIGGGAIDGVIENEIRQMPNAIYSTYGMTETLSHIALRRLNGLQASPYYQPFPSVKLSLSMENTLVIDAPLVSDLQLVTNDVAQILPDGCFSIIGRKDNIVNSGGVKIQIEEVENTLHQSISTPFAISSIPDIKFGEALVLLLVTSDICSETNIYQICKILPKYQQPRYILPVESIPLTESGKINRAACRVLARNTIQKHDNK